MVLLAVLVAAPSSAARGQDRPVPAVPPEPSPVVAGPLSPPGATAPTAVTFIIERIVVEGVRHGSEKIVASETLLMPGSAYTEAQLREALHRVERLPFVVEADFSLRRGSERGKFELVVAVTETRPLFFGGLVSVVKQDSAYGFGEGTEAAALPELGGRVFFGGYHELGATVRGFVGGEGSDPLGHTALLYDATYRHHNLFGRQVVGTAFLRKPAPNTGEGGAELALPLSRASAVKLRLARTWGKWRACAEPCGNSRTTKDRLDLSWLRDTTDDPFTPSLGSRLESALAYYRTSSRYVRDFDPWAPLPQTIETDGSRSVFVNTGNDDGIGVTLAARRYWPVAPGPTLGIGAKITGGHSGGDWISTQGTTSVRTMISRGLRGSATVDAELIGRPQRLGRGTTQLWWVVGVSAWGQWLRTDYDSTPSIGFERAESSFGWARVSCGLAARGRWGIARFELSYEYRFRDHYEYR